MARGLKFQRDCTIYVAKTKALISLSAPLFSHWQKSGFLMTQLKWIMYDYVHCIVVKDFEILVKHSACFFKFYISNVNGRVGKTASYLVLLITLSHHCGFKPSFICLTGTSKVLLTGGCSLFSKTHCRKRDKVRI